MHLNLLEVSLMENINNTLSEDRKNSCAIKVMRTMLLKLSESSQRNFEELLLEFSKSPIYEALFDFETEIWKEGPDYLLYIYQQSMIKK